MNKVKQKRLSEMFPIIIDSMREARRFNTRLFFGIGGLYLALIGYLISSKSPLLLKQKILLTIGILILFFMYLYFSRKLKDYFQDTASTINKIESLYGFFNKGEYVNDDTLLPKKWKHFGSKKWKEPIFLASSIGIILLCIFAIGIIWFY